ncbi:hypothetical protein Vafri_13657 [Volvox africanus]|uniref:RING-CH-type domain-containing protein n=1 Tax=Volvox africanus TaxID=51714 RepID=A0A8J4F6M6_9CHLO|nr:hypothetical protein Vafri_13657 [Volvox africanus]
MCQSDTSVSYESSVEDPECCWICLGEGGVLSRPCMCPRSVHPTCLARWQLQQAGRKEERSCRFCNASLPDWKAQLAPAPPAPVEPVMVVSLGGKAVKMRVKPGPEGMAQFRQQVRELFNIPPDVEFECSFKCKAPSGDTIQLDGLASYEAATHCASLMAAQRAAAASRRAASAPPHTHRTATQPQEFGTTPDAQQQQQQLLPQQQVTTGYHHSHYHSHDGHLASHHHVSHLHSLATATASPSPSQQQHQQYQILV